MGSSVMEMQRKCWAASNRWVQNTNTTHVVSQRIPRVRLMKIEAPAGLSLMRKQTPPSAVLGYVISSFRVLQVRQAWEDYRSSQPKRWT